ncbi:hypothetical protein [Chryseobacterium mucoviscidosis]|uniref:hypothetical protein n=1 Tax=Chryseobacterium TaxID=59732 RepID=UPI0031DD83DC
MDPQLINSIRNTESNTIKIGITLNDTIKNTQLTLKDTVLIGKDLAEIKEHLKGIVANQHILNNKLDQILAKI